MKLRLPSKLVAAIMAAASSATFATLATGSTAYGETTYTDLTKSDYFEANANVYNTGKGTFYLETESCALNLTLTLNLNDFAAYQAVHDYANGGYYSPFVTWTYNNNAGATYGMADVSSGYSSADYSGVTGMWNGSPWTTTNKITVETLGSYADADGNVTLTINNDPTNTTRNVVVTAANGDTLYSADGLRSGNYVSQHITSFTVNMNYVKSLTLNTASTLDSSNFTAPKDYTEVFVKTRDESVGRIVFLGDSITHGVEDMSWRWGLFKTFVDNGIENEIAGPLSGYHSTPLNGDYNGNFSSSTYGGATFDNAHYAQSSGRTHNMLLASSGQNALGNNTGVNYGGVTSAKVGNEYNGDTYIMMMGTNDILSDGANTPEKMASVTNRLLGAGEVQGGAWSNAGETVALVGNYSGAWGTMGQIIDNMQMDAGDTMYVMSIPTWAEGRQNIRVYAPYVAEYNEKLELWTKAYSDTHTGTIKYVDVNRGLIDKTLGGDFLGPNSFFRQVGGDYLHPNEQGALIIAGNLAQGMGLAGRTAGLHRADSHTANTEWVSGAASYTINAGQSVTIGAGELDTNGGYTVDFSAVFGNGATDGWLDKSNALSVSVGDGANVGTLKLSEGYISWGDKLLFCQDNSVRDNDNIRIVYHTGDSANQVGNGYYVWLGDMLIGQALSGSTGTLSGITLSSVGATGTVSGLTYSNTAYAPLSNGIASESNAFYATISKVMTSHDSAALGIKENVTWQTTTNAYVNGDATAESSALKISHNVGNAYTGATDVAHTGSISVQYAGEAASNYGAIGVLNAVTLTGDLYMEFNSDGTFKHWTGGGGPANLNSASVAGSYNGTVTGSVTLVLNNGSFDSSIYAGAHSGDGTTIGGTDLYVNGGNINGSVFGGGRAGTIETDASVTVTGGTIVGSVYGGGAGGSITGSTSVTITGGVIQGSVNGGMLNDTEKGTVTVAGNKASIGGDITAETVKLKDVAASEYSDGFDKYAGTITAANLVLDNYTAGLVNATLVTDYVTVSNGTNAIIRGLHLRNCSIDADATSLLTLGGDIHSGNTISYTGNLYLEDGIRFTIDTPTDITVGDEGFSNGKYIYKVADEGTGHLYAVDGTALTYAHTSTFTGTDGLAGMRFAYDAATGALIAHTADATYKIATSTVNYSDIPSAGSVTMSGGQLNLDTALNAGVTIAATGGTVSVGEGVQFNTSSISGSTNPAIVNNGGTVTLNKATDAALIYTMTGESGTIKLADGVTYTVTGASGRHSEFRGVLDIGSATLKLGAEYAGGGGNEPQMNTFSSIHINGGRLELTGWGCNTNSHQSQLVVDGSSVLLAQQDWRNGNMGFNIDGVLLNADLDVQSGAEHAYVAFSSLSGSATLNVSASHNRDRDLHLYIRDMDAFKGNINVAPYLDSETAYVELHTGDGDVAMGTLSAAKHSSVSFLSDNGHSFTLNGLTATGENAVVNIGNGTAATKVTIDGALAGTVNVLANSTLMLGDNFSAESATIAGAGYVDVHIKPTDEKQYSHDENGYLSATIDLTDYQNKVTFNNAGWKVDGAANSGATFNSETYKLSVAESNVFYVNTTVNQADVTTTAVLVGTGTYALGDGVNALSSNVTLGDAENWQGTVKVTNVALDAAESKALSTLGNANSTVELTGVTKYDRHWANTFGDQSANIRLTDDGDTLAWVYSGGGAGSLSYYMNNTGKWSGEGTFKVALTNSNGFRYAGDISEWTGTFLMASGNSHLTLGGDAGEVNAAIRKEGGTLELRLERDVTFNNTVTVSSLTSNGHTVTLGSHGEGESATHGNLTFEAVSADLTKLVINDGATANATVHNSGTGFMKGTVYVNAGGTLNIVGDDRLGWGNNGTAAINMEGSEGKLATMKVSDKQTFSTTLNLNGYTSVINGDGSSGNKGLEIFQNGGRIGTINVTGTHNTISTGIFLRNTSAITTAEGAELTISGDIGVTGSGSYTSTGSFTKEGAGTLTLSGNNSFGGNLTVNAGTIVMGSSNALGAANNTGSRTITINSGATIDINGTDDRMYKYTLAGGSLVNNGSGTNTGHLQTMGLVLTDDSIIGGTGDYHLINSQYGNTAVDLGGHTLTKSGSNTIGFYSTAVSGAAGSKLRIEGGALNFTRNAGWNQTFTSLDADLEVAKSDSSAVNGEFIMAAGHSISSTEMGGSMNAAIQLGGATTLSIDGVNTLTLNGVLSNAANATGSVTKTGVGTAILNAANTYTGTTTIDAGALIASNSNALSHSVVSFSDLSEEESPYRMLAFAENLSFNGATGALQGGTQIDGTIKGLDGHLGYVVANTLTIDVDGGQTHRFWHRYDENNQTNDRVEMKVDRLVKTGAGTQVIGGDYSEARGFTTNGLVISHGVEVQQGELHMMTRGIVTTDFNVLAGATLKTSDERANSATAAGAVQYNGKVTLHGTTADDAAKLFYEDGATNTVNGLYVDGYGTVINNWDKNQFIGGLFNAEGTTSNELTFLRKDHDDACDVNPAISVLTASGDFAGTIHIKNEGNHDHGPSMLAEKYGLQVLGTGAQNALANTVVDFTGDNVSVLSFRNSTSASSDWTNSKMDGKVAGLTGTNGSVYANTLTVNTASGEEYTYGGALHISGITKQGAGTQILQGTDVALGDVAMQGGTLNFSSGTATANKIYSNGDSLFSVGSASGEGTATVTVTRIELGDMNNGAANHASSNLQVYANGTLVVTGSTNNTDADGYKSDSLVLGEWNADSAVTVSGNLLAQGADFLVGDTGNSHKTTLAIDGGTVAVKGVNAGALGKNGSLEMTLTNGGKLILGADGYYTRSVRGNPTATTTITEGTIGISADTVAFNKDMTIAAATFDTKKYAFNTDGNAISQAENAAGGTLTVNGNISGDAGTLTKIGAGTLILNGATTYTGLTTVSEGTLRINNRDADNNRVHTLGDVVLGQDATLQSYFVNWNNNYSTYKTVLGTVSLGEDVDHATVEATNFGGLTTIAGIAGSGTLTLKNSHSGDVHTTFRIGGSATTAEQTAFHGVLDVQHADNGTNRSTIVIFDDEYSAADAVLKMSAVATTSNRALGIGLNSATVKLKGIQDEDIKSAGGNSLYHIFSSHGNNLDTRYGGGTAYFNGAADGTVRTLELTGEGEYATAAKVGANINIKMSGEGTQTFTGDMSAFNGNLTVTDGTLAFTNAVTTTGVVTMGVKGVHNHAATIDFNADSTIGGLDGHCGTVNGTVLTINATEDHAFQHTYVDGHTEDHAVLNVSKLIKQGVGTQIIGGEYNEGNGLEIANGVEVQEGTLHMKTRGTVTANFEVSAGATLKTSDNPAVCTTAASAMQYHGKVTLHGSQESGAATLNYTDGSTFIRDGLYVDGTATVISSYDKFQFIGGLFNYVDEEGNATSGNDITFTRPSNEDNKNSDKHSVIVLTAAGDFDGTVHVENVCASAVNNHDTFGIQVLGEGAQNALAHAVVDLTSTNDTVLAFRSGSEASEDWSSNKMDGTVAGLVNRYSDGGSVYADNLTVDTATGTEYAYHGNLYVNGITKNGDGMQSFGGPIDDFRGPIEVNAGTLAFNGLTNGILNNLHIVGEHTATVHNNGQLVAGNATLKAKGAQVAALDAEGDAPATHTGTVSNAVFAANSLKGEGAQGGTLDGGLLEIAEAATYTISDMTLTNSVVDATATGAVLNMQNVNIDAASGVAANSGALTGSNRLTLSAGEGEGIANDVTVSSNQLKGLTLTGDSSNLTIDLSAHGYAEGATDKSIFYIELSDFSWDELAGATAGTVYSGTKDINQVFQVLALGSTDTFYKVLSVTQGVGTGFTNSGITLEVQVPEPTTSVLSLLALAGMAARRRRK